METSFYYMYKQFVSWHIVSHHYTRIEDKENFYPVLWNLKKKHVAKWEADEDILAVDMFWQAQLFSLASKFFYQYARKDLKFIYDFFAAEQENGQFFLCYICKNPFNSLDDRYAAYLRNGQSFFRNYSFVNAGSYAELFIRIFSYLDDRCYNINALELLRSNISDKEFICEFSSEPSDFTHFLYQKITDKLNEDTFAENDFELQ